MADITMDIKQVREEIAKGMRTFKAFENAHLMLAALENIEGLGREAEHRISSLRAEEEILVAKCKKMLDHAENVKKTAVESAKSLVDGAKEAAEVALAKAENEAQKLKEEALAKLSAILEKHDKAAAAHEELSGAVSEKETELKKISDALASAKAELGKFVGK